MVSIGMERAANGRVIARSLEEARSLKMFPTPGVIYRIEAQVSSRINDPSAADKLVAVLKKVRSEYPGIMITYAKIEGDSVVIEFVDDPIGVTLGLIIIGILFVVGAAIVALTVKMVAEHGGLPPSSFWKYIAIAGALAGAGYLIGKIVRLVRRR